MVELTWPGEKLVIRMWETLAEKGIGKLLGPWQARREGRARIDVKVQDLLALAQAKRDLADIQAGRKRLTEAGSVVALPEPTTLLPTGEGRIGEPPPRPYDSQMPTLIDGKVLAQLVRDNLTADILRREVNLGKALLVAEADLEEDPQELPTRKVDEDWLFRWRDYAGEVSAETLVNLWGRLLAGEVKSPRTFSLRTLEFLRNLSQSEALAIETLAPFVIDGVVICVDKALLVEAGITDGFLLFMEELGVVFGAEGRLTKTWPSRRDDRFELGFRSHRRGLVVRHDEASRKIKLPIFGLTNVGSQVIRLGTFEANEGYFRRVGLAIVDQGFQVALAQHEQITETQVR